jgi:hypothetical protein
VDPDNIAGLAVTPAGPSSPERRGDTVGPAEAVSAVWCQEAIMGWFLRLSCVVISAFTVYVLWQIVVNRAWP